MFVAGLDGCKGGWVMFRLNGVSDASELPHHDTSVEIVRDIADLLDDQPDGFACLAIDIPIGLVERPRRCDTEARRLLGKPRSSSVFPAPCRASLSPGTYEHCSEINERETTKRLTKQAWGIVPKIKQVDDAIRSGGRTRVFEVHPEVSFWRMNGKRSMPWAKKTPEGMAERTKLLTRAFPQIESHLEHRHRGVGKDDLLDAAAAAWSALRYLQGKSESAGTGDRDALELPMTIHY
jgi:predicted RNase H-like nuclease